MSEVHPYFMGIRVFVTDDKEQCPCESAELAKITVTERIGRGDKLDGILVNSTAYFELAALDMLVFFPEYHDSNVEALDQLDRRVRSQPVVNVTNNHSGSASSMSGFAAGLICGGLFNGE